CNEAFFGSVAARRVRDGAEYLVNLANDTWVGAPEFGQMAFEMARLRAIEERRFLVRASTSGPSAVIDPTGAIQAVGPLGRTVVTGRIRAQQARTLYGRVGDAFAYGCLAMVIARLVMHRLFHPLTPAWRRG